jgi:hypothetical protein
VEISGSGGGPVQSEVSVVDVIAKAKAIAAGLMGDDKGVITDPDSVITHDESDGV